MALSSRQLQALQHLIRQQQAQDDGLLTFRAGRMTMDDNRIVTAKTERGKIKFFKSEEEGLLHLEWINRISNRSDLDIMIFPNSAKWVKVEECKDGRVYVLKFNGSSRREFFWMQEPTDEKDNELSEKINKLIAGDDANAANALGAANNPYSALFGGNNNIGSAATGGTGTGAAAAAGAATGNDALTQYIMNALRGQGGIGTSGASGASGTGGNNGTGAGQGAANQLMQAMIEQQLAQREELKKEGDLSDILDASQNEISNVLDDEKVIERLAEFLPQEMRDRKSIEEQLSSPQFLGSLSRLNHIVNSPQMTVLLQQMGIQPVGDKIGVRAFIEAIIKANRNNNGNGGSSN